MFGLFKHSSIPTNDLLASRLLDHDTFYPAFMRDLASCQREAVIESPFVAYSRVATLLPTLRQLTSRGVRVTINTRQPSEHDAPFDMHTEVLIQTLQAIGVDVLFTGGHHRKLAILDRRILYEGSLNILSQNDSAEIMRRIESQVLAEQMIKFTKLNKFLK
jgi:hypothetical protein